MNWDRSELGGTTRGSPVVHGPIRQAVVGQVGLFVGVPAGLVDVELDVDEAGKYPYEQAYLPYNRLADGTVHDW